MPSSEVASSQSRNICERWVLSRISSPLAVVLTMPIGFMFNFCSTATFACSLSSEYLGKRNLNSACRVVLLSSVV